jgi:hypothetical protein
MNYLMNQPPFPAALNSDYYFVPRKTYFVCTGTIDASTKEVKRAAIIFFKTNTGRISSIEVCDKKAGQEIALS